MITFMSRFLKSIVALFTRAWIEISDLAAVTKDNDVALFTRAWIEIFIKRCAPLYFRSRPLHEGVD